MESLSLSALASLLSPTSPAPKPVTQPKQEKTSYKLEFNNQYQIPYPIGRLAIRSQDILMIREYQKQIREQFKDLLNRNNNSLMLVQMGGNNYISSGQEILRIFNGILDKLRENNKELNPIDKQKIIDRIDNLIYTEKELIKTVLVMDTYKELVELYKDYKSEVLNIEKMNKIIGIFNKLYNKAFDKEEYLLNLMLRLDDKLGKNQIYKLSK